MSLDADVNTLFHYCKKLLKLQQNSLTQINYSHWWCGKYSRFHVTPHKKKITWSRLTILKAIQLQVVMPLYSYQKAQATFALLPEAYEPELHPACTINIENFHFQISIFRLNVEEVL